MTFKDLQRLVQAEGGQAENILGPLHELQGKPFWIWDRPSHKQADRGTKGDCCFNHIIGLPTKDGIKKPMFDYEKTLYKAILEPGYLNSSPSVHSHDPDNIAHKFKPKHLWVKKATGLGITEFMPRFMAWRTIQRAIHS